MLVRAPYTFLFILAVCCWFRHNAAVPLASHSSSQMHDAFKEKETDSQIDLDDTTLDSGSMREPETLDDISYEDDDNDENDEDDENYENDEIPNKISNINRNVNMNMNIFDGGERHPVKHHREDHQKQSTTEKVVTVTEQGTLEEIVKEEASTNCVSSNKKNQRYSSSFFANTTDHTLTVEKEFNDVVGNNSKVKKSSSVHEGEDITLCWIETTTIKEDKTVRPPKRLVIREYTISFENSATIPERYLDCKRFEGELTANDPEVGKTALFEVIDEDTMVSRIVNFTSVSHMGNIISWQHKKVKCGVGPVVSKNIVELNDGSKNPKKRVEITVSPKMHQLTATTTEEEPCTESSEKIEEDSAFTESTERTAGPLCEDDSCEATMTSPNISSKNDIKVGTTEEIVTKVQSTTESVNKKLLLDVVMVPRRSTTFPKIPTTIQEYEEKIDCEENSSDPACLILEHGTTPSEELFPELLATTKASSISDREMTTKEEMTQTLVASKEEKVTSDLTEETTPFAFATDISLESSEASQLTDQAPKVEEYSKSEEGSSESSIEELTSKELETGDHVSSSSVTSGEVDTEPGITTAIPVGFTEFSKESNKPDQILDKVSELPTWTEIVTETITESMSEEVSSEESKESSPSAFEETTIGGLKSEKREFTITSPTKIKSTTSLPTTSGEIDYSCENSEQCASSEGCNEFGNCGETTNRCDSEDCSEIIEDQSKLDSTPPPMLTKVSPIDLFSPEGSPMIETQHTTVATTMLTSQESESNLMPISNIPITMDTRRSTTTSTPRHKLTLKVKVLLEHIDENQEKHNLVEVEKNLLLDENADHHSNPDLLEQLKSLNDSVNIETLSALLNCTSLGNFTRDPNFVSKELDSALYDSDAELEFATFEPENSMSEQFVSDSVDSTNDYTEYQEFEVPQRRRRRSLNDESKDKNKFVRRDLHDPIDFMVDSSNISQFQHAELMKDNLQLSTMTNHPEGETTDTESERNVTKEGDQSTMPSTIVGISEDVDLSNNSESYNANLTSESIQLITTTYKPEIETSNSVHIENEKNIINETYESTIPSIREDISNETKMEVVLETLPGIQEDVVAGLQHMVSQLAQTNLTSIKETVKTNLLDILADPKDDRVRRRRRAATEEVGHWSNERIKEAPMGGNLRSLTEFTLYKVLP